MADIFTMSAKKDAIANMGGLLGVREEGEHVPDVKSRVISLEGYVTYGGMSGRDLAAMAVGLVEGLDEDYLRYRVGQSAYLGARLDEVGVPYQRPAGGHAIFVDAGRLLPHIPWYQYPGQALTVELYVEAGIRPDGLRQRWPHRQHGVPPLTGDGPPGHRPRIHTLRRDTRTAPADLGGDWWIPANDRPPRSREQGEVSRGTRNGGITSEPDNPSTSVASPNSEPLTGPRCESTDVDGMRAAWTAGTGHHMDRAQQER